MENEFTKVESLDLELSKDQLKIIREVNLNILSNIKDLDPIYSKVVDDHFWELVWKTEFNNFNFLFIWLTSYSWLNNINSI